MHTLYPVRLELPIGFAAASHQQSGPAVLRFSPRWQIGGKWLPGDLPTVRLRNKKGARAVG